MAAYRKHFGNAMTTKFDYGEFAIHQKTGTFNGI
jgi:hypothetical protein